MNMLAITSTIAFDTNSDANKAKKLTVKANGQNISPISSPATASDRKTATDFNVEAVNANTMRIVSSTTEDRCFNDIWVKRYTKSLPGRTAQPWRSRQS